MLTAPLNEAPVMVLIPFFIWSQCLCIILAYTVIRTWQQKRQFLAEILPVVMTGMGLMLFWGSLGCLSSEKDAAPFLMPLTKFPLWLCLAAALLLTAAFIVLLLRAAAWEHMHVTPMSIRESFDLLPTGICFFYENGKTGMINRKMDRLCQTMTGQTLQNGILFWERISSGKVTADCEVLRAGTYPIIRTPDGKVYIFSGYELWENERLLCELIAFDITEEYGQAVLLQNRNRELQAINERLRRYGETVTKVTREREILAAKTNIHDRINRVLLTTRRCMDDGCTEEERKRMFDLWGENVLLLCRNTETERNSDPYAELREAADAIGIRLVFNGTLPEDKERAAVMMLAAGECLTNAARHADAGSLFIDVSRDRAVFTNDGRHPDGPIRDGGGITAIRRAAEKAGGSVTVRAEPDFCLTVMFGASADGDKESLPHGDAAEERKAEQHDGRNDRGGSGASTAVV